jgi:hypothetical protein
MTDFSAELIDAKANHFTELSAVHESAKKELQQAREELLELVHRLGSTPPQADKSKRIEGNLWQITAQYGHSVHVDDAIADRLFEACTHAFGPKKGGRFFHKLFQTSIRYSLLEGAHEWVASGLPRGTGEKIRSLFSAAVKVVPKSPMLKVSEKKPRGAVA